MTKRNLSTVHEELLAVTTQEKKLKRTSLNLSINVIEKNLFPKSCIPNAIRNLQAFNGFSSISKCFLVVLFQNLYYYKFLKILK